MLRRQGVKSNSQLERRKSTSSVHGVHLEYLDAAAAQRDAQIAACQAYTRALHRAAVDMPQFPPTPDPSPRRHQAGGSTPSRDGDKETPSLQQSVRFIGPCSVRGGHSESGRELSVGTTVPDQSFYGEKRDPIGSGIIGTKGSNLNPVEQAQLYTFPPPPGRPPSKPLPSIAAGHIEALAAEEEYYTPEDDIASAPSSYRRLRKSRSLSMSDDHQTRPSHDGSTSVCDGRSSVPHDRRAPQSEPQGGTYTQPIPPLRTLGSMNFAGKQNQNYPLSRLSRESTEALTESKTPSLPDTRPLLTAQSTPQLNSRSAAMIYTSRDRRSGLGMPKSLRGGSSTDSSGIPPMVSTMDLDKEDSFKHKAKKASRSLKMRLRSFFSLSRSEEHASSLPIQHIDSQRAHSSEGPSVLHISGLRKAGTELQESIQMVPSGVPKLQAPPGSIHSLRGSFESTRSERGRKVSTDGSLTSWTHSGPSTLTSQQQQQWKNEWERQRLSIIKENGTHCPSPSLRRQGLDPLLFQNPHNQGEGPESRGFVTDSQRIYSALMKRVQAINERTNQIIEQKRRSASIDPAAFLNPEDEVEVGGPDTPPNQLAGVDPFMGQKPWAEQQRTSLLTPRNRNAGYFDQPLVSLPGPNRKTEIGHFGFEFESRSDSGHRSPDPFICRPESPTLPVNDPYSSSYRKSVASDDASSHLFRTKSPFRQTLRKSMEKEQLATAEEQRDSDSGLQGSECGTEIRTTKPGVSIGANLGREISGDYAESVYSTDEAMVAPVPSRPDGAQLGRDVREFLNSRDSLYSIGHHADTSGSSIDWKSWLSANVAKMESPSPPRPEEIEYVMPTTRDSYPSGHVREAAQMHEDDDDDSDIVAAGPLTRQPTLPILPLATIETNVVKPSPHQRSDKHSTPPVNYRPSQHENNSPVCTPPIPPRSMLRTQSPSPLKRHMANKGSSMPASMSSSPGLSAAVQRQFGHVTGSGGKVITYRGNEVTEEGNKNVFVDSNYHHGESSSPQAGAFL